LAVDAALSLSFAVVSVLLGHEPPPLKGWAPLDGPGYALTCLVNLPILVRRRLPVMCLFLSEPPSPVVVPRGRPEL
jgi:hypothetical protein